ncbi:BCCT family transporter [Chryseobacterium wangxinyae]|uniref:BCCT family transporter n=1 Tax=Chryseobacterium sp. CY350 TaxID=2997336 RepID=UPI00226F8F2B|nr:BCCT family transporter [Chryseobacterium sp. CY350]MCY0976796.1 BCCT family transporter [Chryseobacterium sp. CY350]WBZ96797.1 BCCT family transporter [Chryseobacterium sp. CY350]
MNAPKQVSRFKFTFDKGVTIPSLIFIISVCLFSVLFPSTINSVLNEVKNFIFVNLNWVYVWCVTIFVIFLVFLMFSKFGKIRLGSNDSRPEHSFFSWISMLFAAGMGIGLMYFSVAEPMQHYSTDAFSESHIISRAKNAQLYTFFHWGIHAWAIYGLVGLCLAYFAYRYRLPLSLRSCLYPLLKDKITGKWGDVIDIFALCSTFFGITTTLGFGVVQINSGLETLNILPETGFMYQVIIVVVLVSFAVISATSGVNKGVKILSNINVVVVIILLLFVLTLGPTVYLIGSFTYGLGNYINNFFDLTFNTHVYEEKTLPWFYNWTILYWAWWISWSPFVGLFIAKISKGRSIREFIAAVLIIPTLFNFIWMSVFGNSAIWIDFNVANGALSALVSDPDALMFRFLDYLPLSEILSFIVLLVIMIFFVTSADSGMLVMDSISSKNSTKSPKIQTIFWGVLLATLALMLLKAGGLEALQTMTLITALPFAIIMILFVVSLMKALVIDYSYYEKGLSVSTVPWSGEFWKQRLKKIVSYKTKESVEEFIEGQVFTAFTELKEEFALNGITAEIKHIPDSSHINLEIHHDVVNNFVYGVMSQKRIVSEYMVNDDNLPNLESNLTYFPKTYFGDSREGYDVQYFTKNELISDVLKHYDRFLKIVAEESNEMFISSDGNFVKN